MPPRTRRTSPRRGTRSFLKQVADELPTHLPPAYRDYSSEQWGRFLKIWYEDKKVHFEVQFLRNGRLEIGLHFESDREANERAASALERKRVQVSKALGDVTFGSRGPGWRSVAETWSGGDLRSEEAATEAAARLAQYVIALTPLLSRAAK